ncbi:MAG TPA: hypothetical protein PLJ60_02925 [Chryseolinea sp.]|nr:hypothetical protein [Chryseolinea sp.]
MKIFFIIVFQFFLAGLMLIKPVVVCSYLYQDSNTSIVLELTENEEDKSEKKTMEECDEIFHSISIEWVSSAELVFSKKSHCIKIDQDGHIREIVPPPPKA